MVAAFWLAPTPSFSQPVPPPLPQSIAAPAATTPRPANLFSPRQVSTLPFPVQMHGTAVVGNSLYIFGGNVQDIGYSDMVWSAQINSDGNLSPWVPQLPMPELRHYTANAVEVANNAIFICGGSVAQDRRSTESEVQNVANVLYTTVRTDGALNPWKTTPNFGQPRSLIATANNGKHLYITGGARQGTPLDEVICAAIQPNGDLGNWQVAGKLPMPLWFHGAAILDGRMFIWGGLTGKTSSSATNLVWYADIQKDGSLGTWTPDKPLPAGVYSAACSGFNDYLVTIGGRLTGGAPTNDIVVAKMDGGRISQWQTLPTDLQTRYFHSLGLDETRGWIFVTGGRLRRELSDNSRILVNEVRGFQISNKAVPPSPALTALGFTDLKTARSKAQTARNKTVLVYFRSPEVPSCVRFEESLQSDNTLGALLSAHEPAVVDVSKEAGLSYQYGIFKVPSVAIIGPGGTLLRSATGLRTAADLSAFLKQ